MSKIIKIKDRFIGGGNPIPVQSMLNVPLTDTENAIRQAVALEEAGCEIVLGDDCVKGLGMYFAEMRGDFKTIRVKFTEDYKDSNTVKILDSEGKEVAIESLVADEADAKFVTITLKDKADEFGKYKIDINGLAFDVTVPDYFSTEEFENKYTYEGDDLGATWSKKSTTFKVWAPTATTVKLNTYKEGMTSRSYIY
jgi:pullulanase